MKDKKDKKIAKRSYFLPMKLAKVFNMWCEPGRDYSPKVAGAIFLYMQVTANAREICEKLAYEDYVDESSKKICSLLKDEMDKIEAKLVAHDIVSAAEVQTAKKKQKSPQSPSKSA